MNTLILEAAQRIENAHHEHADAWAQIDQDTRVAESIKAVFACSEFVASSCLHQPALLIDLIQSGDLFASLSASNLQTQLALLIPQDCDDATLMMLLRAFRRKHMVRIAWRDLATWADVNEVLGDLSNLADVCIQFACDRAAQEFNVRFGIPRGRESGQVQTLMVLGMGKLGGRELNYSSDIDLVFLYPEDGETDAARPIDNSEYFLRLGQRLVNLLANKTADGFVYRVDMRLRPFGESGNLAVSFAGFEDYLHQHGRDWERYAYVKARPITGVEHYSTLYRNVVRPFVYRRYLDFGMFEALRTMKQLIEREVIRRDLQDNIKLGPGGIREIEFMVQAFQLIRAGGDPRLQSAALRAVLPMLASQKCLPQETVNELGNAYQYLRRVENRLQEYNDEQTHSLPVEDTARQRLALAMNEPDWPTLEAQIISIRGVVSQHFSQIVFGPVDSESRELSTSPIELEVCDNTDELRSRLQAACGEAVAQYVEPLIEQMVQLSVGGYYRRLDETGRRRLQQLLPRMLRLLATNKPAALPVERTVTFARLLRVIEMIGGRTVYLALLSENTLALNRLTELCARSPFLAEQIATFPLLLDELVDTQLFENVPTRAQFVEELAARMQSTRSEDLDVIIEALCQFKRAAMFRIALADFMGKIPLMHVSDRLTDLAELLVQETAMLAWAQLVEKHGVPQCSVAVDPVGDASIDLRDAKAIVVAYGKLGGIELGYGSDLDLVFLHNSSGEVQRTSGPAVIDNAVFFARLGQRLVHLLSTHTRAGRLYEIDVRLRPGGRDGLLVQSIGHFEEYQRNEAWTWEHQALLRARVVAGNSSELMTQFAAVRLNVLRESIRRKTLKHDVRQMRERMRSELVKTNSGEFDLKQGVGGIADLEFIVQYWMLKWADDYPPIIMFSDNIRQLESLASGCIVPQESVDFLTSTYRKYRARIHHAALEGGNEVIADTEFVEERRALVKLWNEVMVGLG